jgi:hypothetical protein
MDTHSRDGEGRRRESRRLVDDSQQLVDITRVRLQTARQRLDEGRNAIQASWLWREVRRRLQTKPDE